MFNVAVDIVHHKYSLQPNPCVSPIAGLETWRHSCSSVQVYPSKISMSTCFLHFCCLNCAPHPISDWCRDHPNLETMFDAIRIVCGNFETMNGLMWASTWKCSTCHRVSLRGARGNETCRYTPVRPLDDISICSSTSLSTNESNDRMNDLPNKANATKKTNQPKTKQNKNQKPKTNKNKHNTTKKQHQNKQNKNTNKTNQNKAKIQKKNDKQKTNKNKRKTKQTKKQSKETRKEKIETPKWTGKNILKTKKGNKKSKDFLVRSVQQEMHSARNNENNICRFHVQPSIKTFAQRETMQK